MSQLETVDENIWIVEGDIVDFYGFPYSTRSVIVRLPDEKLWVWSPIRLTESLQEQVQKLGEVSYLVSPNKIHHLYLGPWKDAFPKAKIWAPQSTQDKRTDLEYAGVLTDETPKDWSQTIRQFHFTGSSFLDEMVFFHLPSKTVIFADLTENFSDEFLDTYWSWWKRAIARVWKIKVPFGSAPLELRLTWTHKKGAREKLNEILDLHPEKVIMAHGEWQKEKAEDYIRKSFDWMLR